MRSLSLILMVLAGLTAMPAVGQADPDLEPEIRADVDVAREMGFEIVSLSSHLADPDRERIESEVVAPVASALAPGKPFGFSHLRVDLDADGMEDLVVVLKIPGVRPPEGFDGAATLVYMQRADGWDLALEAGAMAIALRDGGEKPDLGLVQVDGVAVYRWEQDSLRPL